MSSQSFFNVKYPKVENKTLLGNGTTYWQVDIEHIQKQLCYDIQYNFFNPFFEKSIVVFNKNEELEKLKKESGLEYPLIFEVEELLIQDEDIVDNPLVLPTDKKLRDIDRDRIFFDTGTELFETKEKAIEWAKEFIEKEWKALTEKVLNKYII